MRIFQRLQWRLTFSYTLVTLGALLVVTLVIGVLLFSMILVPHQILPPAFWIDIISRSIPPYFRYVIEAEPIDTELLSLLLEENKFQMTHFDLLRVGDLQIIAQTLGKVNMAVTDEYGVLLGTSNTEWIAREAVGFPIDRSLLPGLGDCLDAAMSGSQDATQLFNALEPNERFFYTVPIFSHYESNNEVIAVAIIYVESLPTDEDLLGNTLILVIRVMFFLLLATGILGSIFGAITSRGLVNRIERMDQVTDSWKVGDFSPKIADHGGDEIGGLAGKLNAMSVQLKAHIQRNRKLAVNEERNRLARDLHDSAKQDALAASFHLGTAKTVLDQDSEKARHHLQEADRLVDEVRRELSEMIEDMRPEKLKNDDMLEVFQTTITEWSRQSEIQADFVGKISVPIPQKQKLTIYKVLRESLANVARHSHATEVVVILSSDGNLIKLVIKDNGVGFNALVRHSGLGLQSMRERVMLLSGELEIESSPESGTIVYVKIPTGNPGKEND